MSPEQMSQETTFWTGIIYQEELFLRYSQIGRTVLRTLRKMMCPGALNISGQLAITFSGRELEVLCSPDTYRTRPPRSLPPLHPLQLSLLIKLHNTIDLSIRMHMILSWILLLAVHVHGGDTEVAVLRWRETDFAAAILLSVHFDVCYPSLLKAFTHILA
jgi:hypothetical protein